MSWLTDPVHVRDQYADEAKLRARRALYQNVTGDEAPDVLWSVLERLQPRRVLEVGGGPGELAARLQDELGASVTLVDLSPRMVELARARGVDALEGDVQDLPFADSSFDTVVAAWMLYHVPDLDRGLAEIARVLSPGGKLVAATNSADNLAELRRLIGYTAPVSTFSRENGAESLRRRFAQVEQIDAESAITVHDRATIVGYADSLPVDTTPVPESVALPLVVHGRTSIFVATR